MRRILYIPWVKDECQQILNEANLWAESYSSRKYKVEKTSELIDQKDTKPLTATAESKLFEVVIYDPSKKNQLSDLGPVTEPTEVHQLYILGHGNPEISALEIYPTRIINSGTQGLWFFSLVSRLIEDEKLPEEFNGKVKLFICKSGIGPTPLKGPLPENRQENSFAQIFTNSFITQRPNAKVYGYTEELVSSYPTGKQIAFKAAWYEESKRIKVGAKQVRVELKKR